MRLVFFLGLILFSIQALAVDSGLSIIMNKMDSDKSLNKLIEQCPTEFFVKSNVAYKNHLKYCSTNPEQCFKSCIGGDANYCSSLANLFQSSGNDTFYAEALFSKSCQLGQANSCTNRASGLIKYKGNESLSCAVKTYELACGVKDAWGCTMFGAYLAQGKGVKKDFKKALKVLEVGCINGVDDPACQNAKNISGQIKAALSQKDKASE